MQIATTRIPNRRRQPYVLYNTLAAINVSYIHTHTHTGSMSQAEAMYAYAAHSDPVHHMYRELYMDSG